jgi:negative regulator of flagellin synthesis FlgM
MKIDGRQSTPQTEAANTTAPAAARKGNGSTGAAGRGDRVEVSADAQLRADALKAASAAPTVRQDKVEAARQKLAAGELGQDSGALADSLIDDLLDK